MARAGSLYIAGIECSFLFGRRRATTQILSFGHFGLPRARLRLCGELLSQLPCFPIESITVDVVPRAPPLTMAGTHSRTHALCFASSGCSRVLMLLYYCC